MPQNHDGDHDSDHVRSLLRHAYDAASIRAMEAPLLADGVPLMRQAADVTAQVASDMLRDAGIDPDHAHVVVLAGGGNNGADGLYAAARLAENGATVTAILTGRNAHEGAVRACMDSGGHVVSLHGEATSGRQRTTPDSDSASQAWDYAIAALRQACILLDAMTGIGAQGPLRGTAHAVAATLTRNIDGSLPPLDACGEGTVDGLHRPLVLAVDTPSGVGIDDGTLPGATIPADRTVTFGALKPCLLLPPSALLCGQVTVVDLGFTLSDRRSTASLVDATMAAHAIRPPRHADSKYTRGVAGLITGSRRYPGAAALSARAASRTNIGMVRYLGPACAEAMVLQSVPEAVTGEGRTNSWTVGSGVEQTVDPIAAPDDDDSQNARISALLERYAVPSTPPDDSDECGDDGDDDAKDVGRAIHFPPERAPSSDCALSSPRAVSSHDTVPPNDTVPSHDPVPCDCAAPSNHAMPKHAEPSGPVPLCVDAGALTLLPERVGPNVVLTPHAGELARLLSHRGIPVSAQDIAAQPWHWACRAHEITGATVLLKGAHTVLVGQDGTGQVRTLVAANAPSWLATAGAGDALAGIMGALLAQSQCDDPPHAGHGTPATLEVAASAAFLHGMAARFAAGMEPHNGRIRLHDPAARQGNADADGAIGHPIVTSDVIEAIPHVCGMLLTLSRQRPHRGHGIRSASGGDPSIDQRP